MVDESELAETSPNQGATGEAPPVEEYAPSEDTGASPLVFVGAAFVGGFALAQILKRLGR